LVEETRVVGEIVDRVILVPVYIGSALAKKPLILDLYDAARCRFGEPLTYLAADKLLSAAKAGRTVIIATGFIVPPWLAPETDGPVGAVTLAKSLNLGFDLTPVIVTDDVLVEKVSRLCEAGGFRVFDYKRATVLPRRAAVESFPVDEEKARREAEALLDRVKPTALIAIERASRNDLGQYHTGVGFNITKFTSKVDFLFDEARRRGIVTIGIGDGGNEIGMGCIKEAVKRYVPTATNCGCPCGAGTHAATETDVLIVASVSNWGAYGLEACLAHAFRRLELLHEPEEEEDLLEEAAHLGFIDPATGFSGPSVDHIPKEIHTSILRMLRYVVKSRLEESIYIEKYRAYSKENRTAIQNLIDNWKEYMET
jgi:hypothetical protein